MIVKVCGTTSEEDALLAVAMGADMVGFVLSPSPRRIAAQQAADIVKRLPREIIAVGVFRDEVPKRVVEIAQRSGMGAVQLHGSETAEQTRWIRERLPIVIKAFPAGDVRVRRAADYGAEVVLLDGARPGSGQVFDWALAAEVPTGQALMIAGGLDADNVASAVDATHPWGVDVSSGVERSPGVKDPVRLRAFVAAAKAAGDSGASWTAQQARERWAAVSDDPTGARHLGLPYDWERDR